MKVFLIFIIMLNYNQIHKELKLKLREGERPKTSYTVPHAQLNQESTNEIFKELEDFVFSFPYIKKEKSIGSLPTAIGAIITDEFKGKANTVIGKEWTHIHIDTGYGSMHVKLNGKAASEVVLKKWGEYHPMNSNANANYQSAIVLLYAPRNNQDLEVIKSIITASYNFVLVNK